MHYLGIDVAKDHLDTMLLDDDAKPISPARQYPNNATGILKLLRQLPDPQQTVVVLETTGVYGKRLVHLLAGRVGLLCSMNPKILRNAVTSMTDTKTDQADALAIAQAANALHRIRPHILTRYAVTEPPSEDLAVWLTEYDRLRKAIARLRQQKNALGAHPAKAARQVINAQQQELNRLLKTQQKAKAHIEQLSDNPDVKRVESIKGVGRLSAAAICRRIGNIDRFENADQLKAYLGIYPARRQSGRHEGKARMARHGDGLVRHLLFNCAKSASKWNPACKALFDRLFKVGQNYAYAWGAVMRKLVQIIFGVLKHKTTWKPDYGLTTIG